MAKKQFNPIVQSTTDYAMFKTMAGNRDINDRHLKSLKLSMDENLLFTVILVNERMEVIDGQHRLRVLRELKKPIHYIVVYGYGKREVQILNSNNHNWNKNDYLISYVNDGYKHYQDFKKYMEDFPDLSFSSCMKILSGFRSNGSDMKRDGNLRIAQKNFERGYFEVKNIKKSYDIGKKIMDFAQYYKKFNDSSFIVTLLGLFDNPDYDHETMMHKLSVQPNMLTPCRNVEQYTDLLEDIYNYRNRNKVSFRYSKNGKRKAIS